ncbi:MAG: NAD(P)-dependent oxidoreductase [Hyphomonadaceae bacterium]|nr:NAD(P)-dependent oxidoreductase [Hyphomonadaceae bacterium]
MLKFTNVAPLPPAKRSARERVGDSAEIYAGLSQAQASSQAERCAQCGVPFCQNACPLQNNIPDWLKLTAEGRLREAYDISAATNPMPEVCGRICPQDRLCEQACVVEQSRHGAVTIGAIEKHITETAWLNGWVQPVRPGQARGQSVGIVGAGPAGLAAAERLRTLGYTVTVYDRHDRIGGLLTYGIPGFKLEKSVVERRARRLIEAGVDFTLNCAVGADLDFETLRGRHDALLIATGVYKARPLDVAHADRSVQALDYLTAASRADFGEHVEEFESGRLSAQGKNIVVIGGGDTAMDCVRTAIRRGAKSVTCLYRRDRSNMPGSIREVTCAEEEGVHFEWLAQPIEIGAHSVAATRMRLGVADADGRQAAHPVDGSAFAQAADLVIAALGFEPENIPALWKAPQLDVRASGALRVNPASFETSIPGVFAAGDIVRGASLVVWALRDGLDAAESMHVRLSRSRQSQLVAAE